MKFNSIPDDLVPLVWIYSFLINVGSFLKMKMSLDFLVRKQRWGLWVMMNACLLFLFLTTLRIPSCWVYFLLINRNTSLTRLEKMNKGGDVIKSKNQKKEQCLYMKKKKKNGQDDDMYWTSFAIEKLWTKRILDITHR